LKTTGHREVQFRAAASTRHSISGAVLVRSNVPTILLLVLSNVFMTFAWYRHLRAQPNAPLWVAILTSWGIALFEYCLAVPANRLGYGRFTLAELKVMQEVISLAVFSVFAVVWMHQKLSINHLWAALCLVLAVFFAFRAGS
jgi:uncharacterized protein